MSSVEKHIIGHGADGYRLDKALHAYLPGAGLRLRRRLCDDGRVLVDGRVRRPGYKVRLGQEIEIVGGLHVESAAALGVKLVARDGLFAAVYKPGGVHSAAIAGRDEPSVEALLSELFTGEEPLLLNRLDNLTSGLLMVGLGQWARNRYQELEELGRIKKFYLARVEGRLDGMITIKNRLDTDNRKTTRVLDEDHADHRRWTDVRVLSHDHDDDTTLVRCLIMKGARHQIRAHLASIGHPIVGDPLYGKGGDALLLHHMRIEFPEFSAAIKPPF